MWSYLRTGHLTSSERGSSSQDRWISGVQSPSGQSWEKNNLFFLSVIKNRFFCRWACRLIIQMVRVSYIDFLFWGGGGGVGSSNETVPLLPTTSNRHTIHIRMTEEWIWNTEDAMITRKNQHTRRKVCPSTTFFPPKILHGLPENELKQGRRRSRQITCAMGWLLLWKFCYCIIGANVKWVLLPLHRASSGSDGWDDLQIESV